MVYRNWIVTDACFLTDDKTSSYHCVHIYIFLTISIFLSSQHMVIPLEDIFIYTQGSISYL